MNFSYRLTAALIGTAIVMVQPQLAIGLQPGEVNAIAKKVTVRIEAPESAGDGGSGVIVAQDGNNYTVLTAAHVVKKPGKYTIWTDDNRSYIVDSSQIRKLPGVDLAVLVFSSDKNYTVAERGDSERVTEGEEIYFAGYPNRTREINQRNYRFFRVNLTGRLDKPTSEGYALIYSGDALVGMSGGPVLDEEGRVIGIHGKEDVAGLSRGGLLGIPINTFVRLQTAVVPPSIPTPEIPQIPTDDTNFSLVRTLTDYGHTDTGEVFSVAISPDGQTFVSGAGDRTIRIWDLATGTLKTTLTDDTGEVFSVAISPDGQTVVSGSNDNRIKVWDLATGTLKTTLTGHTSLVLGVAISPDGRTLVSGSSDRTIKVWDLATGTLKTTLTGHTSLVLGVAISPDGRTLVSGSSDRTIKVWDLPTGTLKTTLTGHTNWVISVAISRDGRTLVSGDGNGFIREGNIKVWDLATGTLKTTLTSHTNAVLSVAISPDGRTLVSGSNDKTIKVWDLATGTLKTTLTGHTNTVYSVAISPDGRTFVSGSSDQTIKIWQVLGR